MLVLDGAGFVGSRNVVVVFLKEGYESGDELLTSGVEILPVERELLVPHADHSLLPDAVLPHLLEKAVALLEGFVVLYQVVEIGPVGL